MGCGGSVCGGFVPIDQSTCPRHTSSAQIHRRRKRMNGTALAVMVVALSIVWGGLILSIIHLTKNPDIDMDKVPSDH
ncbi:methionine/alanine import family NSS transporter small subunit [Moraxella lacunata]|uniref:methionine/alanine import family NSS transporter small subunit n=1 Tax=Moraxella lacunata TaxID=477 RepID=UPI003EDFB6E1